MGVAVQDHLCALAGDDLAEDAVPLEAEGGMLQFGIGRVVDQDDTEIARIAQELEDARQAGCLLFLEATDGHEGRGRHGAGAGYDGHLAHAAHEREGFAFHRFAP